LSAPAPRRWPVRPLPSADAQVVVPRPVDWSAALASLDLFVSRHRRVERCLARGPSADLIVAVPATIVSLPSSPTMTSSRPAAARQRIPRPGPPSQRRRQATFTVPLCSSLSATSMRIVTGSPRGGQKASLNSRCRRPRPGRQRGLVHPASTVGRAVDLGAACSTVNVFSEFASTDWLAQLRLPLIARASARSLWPGSRRGGPSPVEPRALHRFTVPFAGLTVCPAASCATTRQHHAVLFRRLFRRDIAPSRNGTNIRPAASSSPPVARARAAACPSASRRLAVLCFAHVTGRPPRPRCSCRRGRWRPSLSVSLGAARRLRAAANVAGLRARLRATAVGRRGRRNASAFDSQGVADESPSCVA